MKTTHPIKVDTRFWESFDPQRGWDVPEEWQQELYNYIVLGLPPGSFHLAVYAGDLMGAATRTHPSNTWPAIVAMCRWLINVAPRQSSGSYENVENWLHLSKAERTQILEEWRLLTPEKEVAWNILAKTS